MGAIWGAGISGAAVGMELLALPVTGSRIKSGMTGVDGGNCGLYPSVSSRAKTRDPVFARGGNEGRHCEER